MFRLLQDVKFDLNNSTAKSYSTTEKLHLIFQNAKDQDLSTEEKLIFKEVTEAYMPVRENFLLAHKIYTAGEIEKARSAAIKTEISLVQVFRILAKLKHIKYNKEINSLMMHCYLHKININNIKGHSLEKSVTDIDQAIKYAQLCNDTDVLRSCYLNYCEYYLAKGDHASLDRESKTNPNTFYDIVENYYKKLEAIPRNDLDIATIRIQKKFLMLKKQPVKLTEKEMITETIITYLKIGLVNQFSPGSHELAHEKLQSAYDLCVKTQHSYLYYCTYRISNYYYATALKKSTWQDTNKYYNLSLLFLEKLISINPKISVIYFEKCDIILEKMGESLDQEKLTEKSIIATLKKLHPIIQQGILFYKNHNKEKNIFCLNLKDENFVVKKEAIEDIDNVLNNLILSCHNMIVELSKREHYKAAIEACLLKMKLLKHHNENLNDVAHTFYLEGLAYFRLENKNRYCDKIISLLEDGLDCAEDVMLTKEINLLLAEVCKIKYTDEKYIPAETSEPSEIFINTMSLAMKYLLDNKLSKAEVNINKAIEILEKKSRSIEVKYRQRMLNRSVQLFFSCIDSISLDIGTQPFVMLVNFMEKCKTSPNNQIKSLVRLCRTYTEIKDYPSALTILNKALILEKKDSIQGLLFHRAQIEFNLKDYENVKKDCAKISKLPPATFFESNDSIQDAAKKLLAKSEKAKYKKRVKMSAQIEQKVELQAEKNLIQQQKLEKLINITLSKTREYHHSVKKCLKEMKEIENDILEKCSEIKLISNQSNKYEKKITSYIQIVSAFLLKIEEIINTAPVFHTMSINNIEEKSDIARNAASSSLTQLGFMKIVQQEVDSNFKDIKEQQRLQELERLEIDSKDKLRKKIIADQDLHRSLKRKIKKRKRASKLIKAKKSTEPAITMANKYHDLVQENKIIAIIKPCKPTQILEKKSNHPEKILKASQFLIESFSEALLDQLDKLNNQLTSNDATSICFIGSGIYILGLVAEAYMQGKDELAAKFKMIKFEDLDCYTYFACESKAQQVLDEFTFDTPFSNSKFKNSKNELKKYDNYQSQVRLSATKKLTIDFTARRAEHEERKSHFIPLTSSVAGFFSEEIVPDSICIPYKKKYLVIKDEKQILKSTIETESYDFNEFKIEFETHLFTRAFLFIFKMNNRIADGLLVRKILDPEAKWAYVYFFKMFFNQDPLEFIICYQDMEQAIRKKIMTNIIFTPTLQAFCGIALLKNELDKEITTLNTSTTDDTRIQSYLVEKNIHIKAKNMAFILQLFFKRRDVKIQKFRSTMKFLIKEHFNLDKPLGPEETKAWLKKIRLLKKEKFISIKLVNFIKSKKYLQPIAENKNKSLINLCEKFLFKKTEINLLPLTKINTAAKKISAELIQYYSFFPSEYQRPIEKLLQEISNYPHFILNTDNFFMNTPSIMPSLHTEENIMKNLIHDCHSYVNIQPFMEKLCKNILKNPVMCLEHKLSEQDTEIATKNMAVIVYNYYTHPLFHGVELKNIYHAIYTHFKPLLRVLADSLFDTKIYITALISARYQPVVSYTSSPIRFIGNWGLGEIQINQNNNQENSILNKRG